jgi:two-component system, cell cycle sensor histidine kinase and response regulator CckA
MIRKLAIALSLLCLGSGILPAQSDDFQPRKALVVLTDDNYPPYVFRSSDGNLQGIIPDQWKLWSERTGVPVRLQGMDWDKAINLMEKGEADVLDTVFKTPEREAIWDFSDPYAMIKVPIYTSSSVTGISNVASLEGFLIGVKEGDACIGKLSAAGITNFKRYPDYEDIIKDATAGNVHVFCVDEPPALYFMHKYGIGNKFRQAFILYSGQFHRAVKKGDVDTMKLLESGFSKIGAASYQDIDRRWIGQKLIDASLSRGLRTGAIITLACLAALAALILSLRSTIRRRTAELKSTVDKLRESETAATVLLEANPDLLFIFDEKATVLHVKPSSSMPLYTEPEKFLGKNLKENFPPALAERATAAIGRVLSGEGRETMEYTLDMDGGPRCYEARLSRLGEKRVLAIIRDITERKGLEEETIRSHKLESIGVFAGGIAHDFNNILTAIEGNIALARAYPGLPESCSAFLSNAEKAADRAGSLTSQLLAFAKGGSPVRTNISMAAVAKEAATFALSGSACALKAEIGDDPLFALADRNQIAQVVHNIVINASQAMPGGGTVGLKLTTAKLKSGNHMGLPLGEYISIAVSDSGPGIPDGNQKRIFDPYFSTKPGASGLGLSVCHSIIKHHGGGIDVYSKPGFGTVFTVFIPASKPESVSGSAAAQAGENRKPLREMRALVMDDEDSVRQLLSELLKDMDMPHELAETGERGLELFKAASDSGHPYDIVFADLTVPGGMGGKEMMRGMRLSGLKFKSVVISGYSNDPIMSDYRQHGFDACLMKPFKIMDFQRIVEQLCAGA